jgi:signal transduction histidine kinase
LVTTFYNKSLISGKVCVMLRSPFLFLLSIFLLLSCEEKKSAEADTTTIRKVAADFREKGIALFQQKSYNASFYNFNKSKSSYETLKDTANVVYVLIQMASIQQINGDYYGSKETLTEALPYIQKKNIYSASINNFFGIAYKELSIYNEAIQYYKEAVKECEADVATQSPLNNIAVVYILQKKYKKAIELLDLIHKNKSLHDPETKARVTDNLGYAYFKAGDSEKAIALMQESYSSRVANKDMYGSIESNLHLAEYYLNKNLSQSNYHAMQAYNTATKLNSIDERLKALQFLISNNYNNEGIQYANQYIALNNQIVSLRNNYKNKFAKIKYDSKKEKEENQKLRLEKIETELTLQKAHYQKIFFIIGIIALSCLLLYLKKFYQNRNRIEKMQTAYETETRIAKDIHDELANDIFNAITFTQTQSLEIGDKKHKLIQKLNDIYGRVRGISREHSDIDTGTTYADNLKDTLSTYNNENRNIIISNAEKINWEEIDNIKKITIFRTLQELMVNMQKHSQALIVVIIFGSLDKKISIEYTDNGKGCDKNKILKNGLQNMENRILAIKGTITFDTEPDKGFKVKITMPK